MILRAQRATDATSSSSLDSTTTGAASSSTTSGDESRSGNGAGPAGDVLIELHDVSKAFGKKAILKGATMKIRRGEAVGIIGAQQDAVRRRCEHRCCSLPHHSSRIRAAVFAANPLCFITRGAVLSPGQVSDQHLHSGHTLSLQRLVSSTW